MPQQMHISDMPRWFRSGPQPLPSGKVDREMGIIRDVVMCAEGPAKGHGVELDADFIAALVKYDQKHHKKTGLKARFGHPGASSETMGTQLGVFNNFRQGERNGKQMAIADLQLLDASEQSPTHPGMRTWVLDMAEERPDFIMSSIVFTGSGYFQKLNGKNVRVWEDDKDGNWVSPIRTEPIYVDFDEKKGAKHYYTDLVEAGAATETLYSTTANPHLFVAQADAFLNANPHLIEFIKENPSKVQQWLQRAGLSVNDNNNKMKFDLAKWLFGANDATPTTDDLNELRTALNEAREEIIRLKIERDDFETKFKAANTLATQLAADAKELRLTVEQLKADIKTLNERVGTIAAQPAAEPTGGETPPSTGEEKRERAYKSTPINRRLYQS